MLGVLKFIHADIGTPTRIRCRVTVLSLNSKQLQSNPPLTLFLRQCLVVKHSPQGLPTCTSISSNVHEGDTLLDISIVPWRKYHILQSVMLSCRSPLIQSHAVQSHPAHTIKMVHCVHHKDICSFSHHHLCGQSHQPKALPQTAKILLLVNTTVVMTISIMLSCLYPVKLCQPL